MLLLVPSFLSSLCHFKMANTVSQITQVLKCSSSGEWFIKVYNLVKLLDIQLT
jgi:hypothetical protein